MSKKVSKKLKVLVFTILVLAVGTILAAKCIERIPAGYVGVVYSPGSGVREDVLTQGWHMVAPTDKVTEYSVATEQLNLARGNKEGSKHDASFDVTCKDGKMNVDFEMSYSFRAEDAPHLYTKYRGLDGKEVVDTIITSKIKTHVSEVTSQYSVLEAHMEKKAELNNAITQYLREELAEFGIIVESANLPRTDVDPQVEQAIIERSKVSQELEIEKQKQEKTRLEAENKKIQAEGEATKKLIEAENQAEIIKLEAQAEAAANRTISDSITPELLTKMEMEARIAHGWVTVTGGSALVDARSGRADDES